MSLRASSIDSIRYRPGGSWPARVGRSNLFAWAVSIGLHGAVFFTLYLAVFHEEAPSKRVIIPEARLAGGAGPTPRQSSPVLKLSRPTAPSPADRTRIDRDELPLAAITLDAPPVRPGPADEPPGSASALTSEAMTSPMAAGPVSTFFGQAGNAREVVYVVDVSASLMIYEDDIVREMRRSIRELVPSQRFHIVMAGPLKVEEFAPRRLVPAIGTYKAEAMRYLDTIPEIWDAGKADPIEAMKRAFAAGPELVYFLSDGDYSDLQADLMQALEQLNPHREVKITVIGFAPRPRDRDRLEQIARHHGGHFRVVEPK